MSGNWVIDMRGELECISLGSGVDSGNRCGVGLEQTFLSFEVEGSLRTTSQDRFTMLGSSVVVRLLNMLRFSTRGETLDNISI